MKKFVLIFVLIFSLSFFCGCNKKEVDFADDYILSSIAFSSNGQIVQSLGFGVDSEKIDSLASSQYEGLDFKSKLIDQVSNLRNQFLLNFAVIYLENPKEEYKFNAGIKLTAARYEEKIDAVCFEIIFSSVDAWNYYHQASHQKSQPDKVFLFSKKESTSMFPFSAVDKNGTLIADRYREVYLSASRGLSFESKLIEEYSPQFVYSYSTYFSSLKSDADLRISNSGQYTHFWIREYKDVKTHCNTTLYYYQVNKGMWILLTLILVILSLGIFLIIYKRKNKLQK